MLALYRTISFRYLRQHWPRASLIIASIALGVATLVATRSLSQCMSQATRSAVTPMAGVGDLLVTRGDQGVPRALADELARANVPGIKEINSLVIGRVALPDLDNRPAILVGVDLNAGSVSKNAWGVEVKVTNLLAMLPGSKTPPAFLGKELAEKLPAGGNTVLVRSPSQIHTLALAGTMDGHGPAATLGGTVVIMNLMDAATLLGRPDIVSRIDLTLTPEADHSQVRKQVQNLLAGRAQVRTPQTNDQMVHDVVGGIELGFALGGFGALIIGLFLVYNALSVSVAERRHDIGILRSVGATRRQIAFLFAGEACLLGLAGAVVGLPLGLLLAEVSAGPLQKTLSDIFIPLENTRAPRELTTLLGSGGAGIAMALLAALVPAWQAASEEPADAVRRVPVMGDWRLRLLQVIGTGSLIGGGIACFLLRHLLPNRSGTFISVSLVLLGGLLATPWLAAIGARLLRPLARPLLGIEGRLAADNLARCPGRTGMVIAALAAGTALLIETAGLTHSSEAAVVTWIDQAIAADLFLTSSSAMAGGGDSQLMPEELGREIEQVPGVGRVLPVRFRHLEFRDKMVFLIALDALGCYEEAVRVGAKVPGLDLYPRLSEPGTVLVSENFAALHNVQVGDRIQLPGKRGFVDLQVLGIVLDYSWSRGTMIMDRQRSQEQFNEDKLVDAFDVYLKPTETNQAEVADAIRRTGADHHLIVLTRDQLRQTILDMIRRLYSISYAQQMVVMLVAALGVVMALLISVLQRRRELGLLRAVGASQSQVLKTLLAEAGLVGLLGAFIGLLLGIPLEWYAVRVILFEETGFTFPVRIPWQASVEVVGVALLAALIAGIIPALHAIRMRITDAIAYE